MTRGSSSVHHLPSHLQAASDMPIPLCAGEQWITSPTAHPQLEAAAARMQGCLCHKVQAGNSGVRCHLHQPAQAIPVGSAAPVWFLNSTHFPACQVLCPSLLQRRLPARKADGFWGCFVFQHPNAGFHEFSETARVPKVLLPPPCPS